VDRVPYSAWRDLIIDCINPAPEHRPNITSLMLKMQAIPT